jgi:aspartyl-tRNA(Asn)/glutamyl-tRNA(Gln) amidotransferase subunit A
MEPLTSSRRRCYPGNSYASVTERDEGVPDGIFLARPERPAAGIRLAVKDLFDTAGLTTTYGSILFVDHVPDRTATAVARLEAAGYANVGKANLHEFAYGVSSVNPHFGTVPNPLSPERIAGGSSGGSAAALAAGLADVALGTDSAGSIRIPAACCGVVGFKPSYGLVPLDGCFPLAPSFDHAGPLAPTVSACADALAALAPEVARGDPVELGDLTVGVAWLDRCEPLVRARLEGVSSLFSDTRPLDFPLPHGLGAAFMRESAEVHGGLFPEHADAYGENVRTKLERALGVTDAEADAAARARVEYRERAAEALDGVDLLLTPTLAFVAPRLDIDELAERGSIMRFTQPFNALGWPALALPCGPAEHGLPASVQLVAPAGHDGLVLAAGEALERALASLDRGTPRPS